MENSKFQTIINAKNEKSIGDITFTTTHGRIILANPTHGYWSFYLGPDIETEATSDRDLCMAWHHCTIERKHGPYATKNALKTELEARGYELSENGHRWKKKELINS